MSPITARRYPDVYRRQCTPRAWSSWISHGATKRPPGNRRPQKGEPGKCRLSPGSRRAGPFVDRPLLCSSWNLPAPQNRVGQDTRPEKQRGCRQQDGRTTALRNASPAARWRNRRHSSWHHHGGVLTHCHRHQDQHGQESGHSQKNCPLHPVLLLSTLSLKWPALDFSSREGTHSVQNRNAKVSIILTIFNEIEMRQSPAWAKSQRAGAEGFEPSGVLPPLVFKTSAFVRSAMPPHTFLWRRLYELRAEHLSSGGRASPGWCTMFVCKYRLEAIRGE